MKKPEKNFVVEYKATRRKPMPKPNSIWGSVDLRQFAEDDNNLELPPTDGLLARADAAMPDIPRASSLKADLQQKPTSNFPPEEQMADEMNVTEQASTEADAGVSKALESKKRGPRAKKAAPDIAASVASVETPAVKKTRAKRGSKNVAAEVKPAGRRGGRKAKVPVEAAIESAPQPSSSVTAGREEMEDLLQLEQENQRLRKLLAEKLRAENVDLRKRLGLD